MREIIKQWIKISAPGEDHDPDYCGEIETALTCETCSCLRVTREEAAQLDVAWDRTTHPCYTEICECERERKPSNCQRCNSDRILEISDRSRGSSDRVFHHMQIARRDSYALHVDVPGLDEGDGVTSMLLCMQCGQVQGTFPVADPDVTEKQMDLEVLVQAVRSYNALDF